MLEHRPHGSQLSAPEAREEGAGRRRRKQGEGEHRRARSRVARLVAVMLIASALVLRFDLVPGDLGLLDPLEPDDAEAFPTAKKAAWTLALQSQNDNKKPDPTPALSTCTPL